MSATVEAVESEVEVEDAVPTPAEAAPPSLYKYSVWAHAGHGAEECSEVDEEAGTCTCGDSAHFHAYLRLPNKFQQRDIRERALAAKARRGRQLRLQGSDANEILEQSLEELQAQPEAKDAMVNELLGNDWWKHYVEAMREVKDQEDVSEDAEEGTKLYAHVEDDQTRYHRLSALPEDERNADEFEELEQHLNAYQNAVADAVNAIAEPKRASLLQNDDHELLDLVRRQRIDGAGQEEFSHHYNLHLWLSCTYKEKDGNPFFRDAAHLEGAAPEVLECLEATFADLERTASDAAGN